LVKVLKISITSSKATVLSRRNVIGRIRRGKAAAEDGRKVVMPTPVQLV
jgi:hypothetical protein